jgi:hypothetical protein
VCHLLLGDAEGDLVVEPGGRADDGDLGVGIEAVEDAAGRDLPGMRLSVAMASCI